jgi:hypothetical protein
MDFLKQLQNNGWQEVNKDWEYRKGKWVVYRDTSRWFMVGTEANPRVFDVPYPTNTDVSWSVNLIEHLCEMEDERNRLRQGLEQIASADNDSQVIAKSLLKTCYHTWITKKDGTFNYYCPICSNKK